LSFLGGAGTVTGSKFLVEKDVSSSIVALEATPEELKAAATGTVATFGTGSANEADQTISRRPEASLLPNDEGVEQKYSVSLAGDELKTVTVKSLTGLKID
jgi:hypothetical protein